MLCRRKTHSCLFGVIFAQLLGQKALVASSASNNTALLDAAWASTVGWDSANMSSYCVWSGVTCDANGSVISV